MRIEINSKKLSYSSNIKNRDIILDEDTQEIINQLHQQIMYGNNSCFLISGYRGTGKTTLITNLENGIKESNKDIHNSSRCLKRINKLFTRRTNIREKDEEKEIETNIIFIHMNCTQYENYSLILRKLIREIYLVLVDSKCMKKIRDTEL